ncbi:trans-acting enoyl reductase family protein [Sphingosinicella sp. CPCC 101087]|uniref:saccharopine dehydrogenase family protein n=1 Tax=Sphingosinicella sp. CPCC 101087 TaxID=2497754 RepID=UPI00197D3FDA|nr:saccharopine dehydrogenase NADP-binding domain-containing protein [Sphingosinicella sp. CPCC 101087]
MDLLTRKSSEQGRVAIFGANGHTGRFLVSELERRGLTPVAVGRSSAKLEGLGFARRGMAIHEASLDDPASLDRAFAGVAAVVNCAGPFLETADAVAAAALRAGAHYLDVTAEQPSARAIFERFDAPARDAGLVVMPAMGFYGGLADLLVTAALDEWEGADEIRIGIALDSWHPTKGTRITGERNTARRLVVADGRLEPLPSPPAEMDWEFPPPFHRQGMIELPFSEIVLISQHVRTAELHTYLNGTALRDVRDPATPPPEPADETGRSAQRFLVEAIVRRSGRERRLAASGQDIYAFSAPLVCEAVERILRGESKASGALAPGAAFEARAFLEALAPDLLTLDLAAA